MSSSTSLRSLCFQLASIFPTHGFVFARVGLDPFGFAQDRPGAIHADVTQL